MLRHLRWKHNGSDSGAFLLSPSKSSPWFGSAYHRMPSDGSHEKKPRVLRWQIFRWLLTAAILAAVIVTLSAYERKGNFSNRQKDIFNTIITALGIILALSFFDAFKDLAKVLRWKVLETEHDSVDVELILQLDKIASVAQLGWRSLRSFRKPVVALICFTWLFINLAAQVSVALVSQVFSLVDGKDYNGTFTATGNVSVPDLSCYFGSNRDGTHCPIDQTIVETNANVLGNSPANFDCGPYNTTADILGTQYNYPYYCRRTPKQQEFAHRFLEYNPNDTARAYPAFTDRIITASSGECIVYDVVGSPTGNGVFFNYTYTNGSVNGTINIPQQYEALSSTIYVYRGTATPQDATIFDCGPRCIWMWAHKSIRQGGTANFYQCPITVSEVSNATDDRYKIGDGIARIAAASIALQGKPVSGLWTQFQFYPYGNPWDIHLRPPDVVGAHMAEYALRSIASMAQVNPQILISNRQVPILGTKLEVQWNYVITLCAGIAAVHLFLAAATMYGTRGTTVQEDTPYNIARLVNPVVETIYQKNAPPRGYDIHRSTDGKHIGGFVYGPHRIESSTEYEH